MKYESGTNIVSSTCLPPEAYIKLWNSSKSSNPPKFKSSVYPRKKKNSEVQPVLSKNKSH
jgi:hypothetical protein